MFTEKNINGCVIVTDDNFTKHGVTHAFTTRHGGMSSDEYSSLNLGFNRGDDNANVMENFKILACALNRDIENFVLTKQTHNDITKAVTAKDKGKGILIKGFDDCDALMTNVSDLVLCGSFADCVPILMYDTVKRVACVVHSGWKGTVKMISFTAIKTMINKYNSNTADIICSIGPSIGACCFEIGEDVKNQLNAVYNADKYIFIKDNKTYADLWQINKEILLSAGVLSDNISILGECTVCNSDNYFSHRVSGDKRGALSAVISL